MGNNFNNFEEVSKSLLKEFSGRAKDVIERRFGIGSKSKRQTLEAIGQFYKITRERVRQIEDAALNKLRLSQSFDSLTSPLFEIFQKELEKRGGVCREDHFIAGFAHGERDKNYALFFLFLGSPFSRLSADGSFYSRWTINKENASKVERAVASFAESLGQEPLTENEILDRFNRHVAASLNHTLEKSALLSWLGISKEITVNPLGEWGLNSSLLVRPRGMRDFAYLVLKKHGSPLHFREVAKKIEDLAGRRSHVQTVHNELIKDDRFILVGRGLYALSGWGYQPGTIKDIITNILKNHGPLSKVELVQKALQERHVKENTVLINLQNKTHFKRLDDGLYHLA
ncbi:MAG: sigma factor-like helix-turn-helix DNA-binding protein [Patescibacteria group bacterium]